MEDLSLAKTQQILGLSIDQVKLLHQQGLLRFSRELNGEPRFFARDVRRLRSGRRQSLSEDAALVNIGIQRQMSRSLILLRRALLVLGGLIGAYAVGVVVLTLLFIYLPVQTADWLGIVKTRAAASLSNGVGPSWVVAADSATLDANKNQLAPPSTLQSLIQPAGKVALNLVHALAPQSYAAVSAVAILDPNDILKLDPSGTIIPTRPLTISQSSLLKVDSNDLIANLNSQYLEGKHPGSNPGDIAIVGQIPATAPNPTTVLLPNTGTVPLSAGLTLNGSTATVNGLTVANFASPNLSQWINDTAFITNSSTGIFSGKTISGFSNTLSNISNAALVNPGLIVAGTTGSGAVALGTTLSILGGGITTSSFAGGTLTLTTAEADTLASVTSRGSTTATALNLSSSANVITVGALTATGGAIDGVAIGAASPNTGVFTTVNGLTLTNNGANTLNIAAGKSLSAGNSLTFIGTDGTTFALPVASDTVVGRSSVDTLTNKTINAGSNTISGLTAANLTAGNFSAAITTGTYTINILGNAATATNFSGALLGDVTGSQGATTVGKINGTALGATTATSGNVLIASGSQWVTQGLSGDAALTSAGLLTLKNTGTAGSYGSALNIPVLSTDAQGRVTNVTPTAIAGLTTSNLAASAGLTNNQLANSAVTINTTGPLGGGGLVSLGGVLTIACPTCLVGGGSVFTAAASSGPNSLILQGGTLTLAAGSNLTTTNNSLGTVTFATVTGPSFTTVNGLTITSNGTNTLSIATGKTLSAANSLTLTGTDGTSFAFPVSSDDVVGRTSIQTLTNKTLAAGSNTISGLTNANLSGAAGVTNANLANSSIATSGNSGSGSVALGGGLTLTGAGITSVAAAGSTLTVTSTEADTLSSVTGRGASTATALTLNGGVTTTTSTALTLDSGTTGNVNLGTGATAKTITIGNSTGTTGVNINSGTGNVNFTVDGTGSSGKVQIGNSGTATPDLLVLDNGTADPTGVNGGTYYNTTTNKFRCYQNGAWTNCIGGDRQTSLKTADQSVTSSTTLTSDSALTFSVGSGETWVFNFFLFVTNAASAQPDFKAAVLGASGWTCSAQMSGSEAVGAAFPQAVTTGCTNAPTAMVNANIASDAGNGFNVRIQGTITTTSAGSVTLQFAQNTSSTSAITIKGGSYVQAFKVGGADLAEAYRSKDASIEPGDVVALDPSLTSGVQKSQKAADPTVLGIVSTRPGMVLGDDSGVGNVVLVALSGRVPVKVSSENGAINPGDYLTSSSTPGVAMKATTDGLIIGLAMTGFGGSGVGSVITFIKNGPPLPPPTDLSSNNPTLARTIATAVSSAFKNTVDFFGTVVFHADAVFQNRPTFNSDTVGQAVIPVGQSQVRVSFKKVATTAPIVTASLTLTNQTSPDQIPSYAVYDVSTKGFTVKLAKPVTFDVPVAWTALTKTN